MDAVVTLTTISHSGIADLSAVVGKGVTIRHTSSSGSSSAESRNRNTGIHHQSPMSTSCLISIDVILVFGLALSSTPESMAETRLQSYQRHSDKVMHANLLRALLQNAPSPTGRQNVAAEINACIRDQQLGMIST
jgi:hypothetical protein